MTIERPNAFLVGDRKLTLVGPEMRPGDRAPDFSGIGQDWKPVNLASSAGITGIAYNSAYCMSKGAVVQLTRSMALEFTNTGLRVNAIAPGAVDTPMVQKLEVPDDIDFGVFLRSSAPGRPAATPQQVAELVAYLASEAASAINGAVLSMDGGASAG